MTTATDIDWSTTCPPWCVTDHRSTEFPLGGPGYLHHSAERDMTFVLADGTLAKWHFAMDDEIGFYFSHNIDLDDGTSVADCRQLVAALTVIADEMDRIEAAL